jgi:hypothetical protein
LAFALMVVLLFLAFFGEQSQSPSRIVAGGSAGTWLLVGFSGYLIVGVLAVGLSALFYHYIEVIRGQRYTGANQALAWAHLILLNVGALGGSWLMILAGYVGGSHLLSSQTPPPAVYGEVHEMIAGYILPIAAFMVIGVVGVLLGGLGYVRAWFGKGVTPSTA